MTLYTCTCTCIVHVHVLYMPTWAFLLSIWVSFSLKLIYLLWTHSLTHSLTFYAFKTVRSLSLSLSLSLSVSVSLSLSPSPQCIHLCSLMLVEEERQGTNEFRKGCLGFDSSKWITNNTQHALHSFILETESLLPYLEKLRSTARVEERQYLLHWVIKVWTYSLSLSVHVLVVWFINSIWCNEFYQEYID